MVDGDGRHNGDLTAMDGNGWHKRDMKAMDELTSMDIDLMVMDGAARHHRRRDGSSMAMDCSAAPRW